MLILETKRLQILEFEKPDAKFVLKLVNEPAWIKFIGNKNVKTQNDASNFIGKELRQSYKENGFGLLLVKQKYLKN